MTPERIAELLARWVRFYTRNLPTPIAQRRIGEIDADLHDHIAHERASGNSDRRIALSILSRMARGLTADASWRRQVRRPKGTPVKLKGNSIKTILTLLATPILAAIGIAAIIYGEADDSPGGQLFGALLVIGAVWLGVRAVRAVERSKR